MLFIGPMPVTPWNFFPGNVMAFISCFFSVFSLLEKCNWTILWRGETLVSCREEEGLCVWSISDHTGQIHQYVCSIGWAEKYEVQCEEWPFSLQAVSGKEQQDLGFCCHNTGFPPDGSSCSFSWQLSPQKWSALWTLPCVGQFTLKLEMHSLTVVRHLSNCIFFMLFFQQQKSFCLLMPSCQILWSWCMLNIMNIFCSV